MSTTSLITPLDILWKILKLYGHDPAPVFKSVGISSNSLKISGERISLKAMNKIWDKADLLINDTCFGLRAAQFWHPSHLNALGYSWLASRTLREAMNRLERYWQVIGEGAAISIRDEEVGVSIIYYDNPISAGGYARVDSIIACAMQMCRINYGENLDPVSIHLIRTEPQNTLEYKNFFNVDVNFDSTQNSITIPFSAIDKQLIGGNTNISRLNDQIIIKYLATFAKRGITNQVKDTIFNCFASGEVSKERIALSLNMSVRTMQRKLKGFNTSFSLLLDETRKELAISYLREPENDLAEISFLLGFSQPSSFSRAFKRWTQKTPIEFRNNT
jgi:AraC-like DNA-binding protein